MCSCKSVIGLYNFKSFLNTYRLILREADTNLNHSITFLTKQHNFEYKMCYLNKEVEEGTNV